MSGLAEAFMDHLPQRFAFHRLGRARQRRFLAASRQKNDDSQDNLLFDDKSQPNPLFGVLSGIRRLIPSLG